MIRSEIDEGLKKLSQIKPAGETYMHEGMKAVSTLIYNITIGFQEPYQLLRALILEYSL